MREEFIAAASCRVGRVFEFGPDSRLTQAIQAVLTLPDGNERVVNAFDYCAHEGQDSEAPGVRLFLDPPGDDRRVLFVAVHDPTGLVLDAPRPDVGGAVDPDDEADDEWLGDDVEFNDGF